MTERIDIMVDIETLGNKSDSTIFQIAAAAFNIETGEIHSRFNQIADIEKNENPISVTGSTIKWWLATNKELLHDLLHQGVDSSEGILRSFNQWIKDFGSFPVYLWGNGILFDNNLIKTQLGLINIEYPIHFKNDRDVRTILEIASRVSGKTEKEIKDECNTGGVEHDAMEDVIYQIALVTHCNQLIMNRGE